MSFAFRIHDNKNNLPGAISPVPATNMQGWTQTGYIAGQLLANIDISGTSGKIATSIPSIFARIFLFDIAFQSFKGHPITTIENPPTNLNLEASLVSECLDLLEFLFQHAEDNHLVIKHWNKNEQVRNLKNSYIIEHQRLGRVLEDEINNHPELSDIYLFFWRATAPNSTIQREFLIGGTSPFTLAFTAPNWKDTVLKNGFNFTRTSDGSILFDLNNPQQLRARSNDFKIMLYSLRMAYSQIFLKQASNFEAYISTCYDADVATQAQVAPMGGNPGGFNNKYKSIKDISGAAVVAAALPLCYEPLTIVSGYEIVPKVNRYGNYVAQDGSNQNIPTPLMLNDNGLPNVPYIGQRVWNSATCKINEAVVRGTEMHNRVLPGGMGVKYPFLIWSDFLEDKIIKVPYKVDNNRFITATNGDAQFLLPLRREFFKYFEITDVSNILTITVHDKSVDVTLRIPIKDANYGHIDIRHTYTAADIVSLSVTLGFFPFYRTGNNDRYRILQCGDKNFNASFYDVNGNSINSPYKIRTKDDVTYETRYYSVNQAFDIIELNNGGCKALVIPNIARIDVGATIFNFAVDFGTSNTYIAYNTNQDATPRTLEFSGQDQQTVYMHSKGSLSGMLQTMSSNHFQREFTPEELGQNALFHFPTPTSVCEVSPADGITPELFSTISIGFKMMQETTTITTARYITQLKWILENNMADPHNNKLVEIYFTQILWILKNKAIQNGGNDAFNVHLTFPATMPIPLKNTLLGLWNNAKSSLGLSCNINGGFSESLSPYNIMVPKFGTSSFLNIDIGGGTHDMLFINRDDAGNLISANYSSSRFAGDDLWGDGVVITNAQPLANGFANYLYNMINSNRAQYNSKVLQPLDTLKGGMANTSGDIMGYLFSHDDVFHVSTAIRANQTAYTIIFIHYIALMYHVARLIKKQGVGIPNCISFTGMGSKYMNLISPNAGDVGDFTKLLLEKFVGKRVPALFSISNNRSDAKEITAKGTLTIPAQGFQIPQGMLSAIVDYGFDCDKDITYGDIRKPDVQKKVLEEFNVFINYLKDRDIANHLHNRYNVAIPDEIINIIKINAQNSYNTIVSNLSHKFDNFNISETLFFYPLKNALIECSKKI